MKKIIITSLSSLAVCSLASGATYMQNFTGTDGDTGASLGDGSDIRGTGFIQGNALQLTDDALTSEAGAFVVPAMPDSSLGWVATFNFEIFDGPDADPADGFSFSYGAIGGGNGAAEAGWDSSVEHVSFEIDTWQNGAGDNGTRIGGRAGANNWGTGADDNMAPLANNAGNLLDNNSTATGFAAIKWDPANGVSFRTTGLQTNADFTNVDVPGFSGDDSYGFAFSARTGFATQTNTIDNLTITTGVVPEPSSMSLIGLAAAGLLLGRRRR